MNKTLLSLALITLLPAGCAIGPDYHKPETVAPAAFKHQAGWQPMPQQAWQQRGDWWLAFGDDQLTALVSEATAANQTIAQAEASYRAAQAQRRGAQSEFFPRLGANVSGNRSGGSDAATSESASADLSLNWAIDLWGRIRRQVEADTASLDASAADLAAARLAIQLDVAQTYMRLRAIDRQRDILDQTLAAYQRSAQLTRNQYDAGIVSRADVIQAETQLQSLRSDSVDLDRQRALEENALAALLGQAPLAFDLPRQTESLPAVPALPAELPTTLLARRPDVVAAERLVAAANARIGVAQAAWLPDLNLNAIASAQAGGFSALVDNPLHVWSVGPALAQTLFDGGQRRTSIAIAEAQYDQQVAAYRQTVLNSLRDVENALATLTTLATKAEQQDALVKLAEENERVITNRYKSGLVSFLEVATAQNTTLNARRVSVDVHAERLTAALELAGALGGGWSLKQEVAIEASPMNEGEGG